MKSKRMILHTILPGLLTGLLLLLLLTGCGKKDVIRVKFSYQSGAVDEESYFYYQDSFFDHPSTEYNPSLATASLSFAMASFASTKEEAYTHRWQNIEAVLQQCGFQDLYANPDYFSKPGTDTLGVVIAQKQRGDKTLLAVGLRGANYESEWASNFTIGDGLDTPYHLGFFQASEIILEALQYYVDNYKVSGTIQLWLSGYSRAGASCNLAAGRINEYIRDGIAFLGEEVSLAREDLYTYCFEAPRGVLFDESTYPKSDLFNNIFCITNRNDPVPQVVMEALHFTRFGVEVVLPDSVTELDFATVLNRLKIEYGSLRSFGDWGTYRIADFQFMGYGGAGQRGLGPSQKVLHWTQGLYLEELLDLLARYGIRDRGNYTDNIQAGLRDMFRLNYAHKNTSSSLKDLGLQFAREVLLSGDMEVIMDDLLHNRNHLIADIKPVLTRAMMWMGIELDTDEMILALTKLLASFAEAVQEDFDLLFSVISLDNMKAVASAHYPELCLAFLRIMDPLYTKNPVKASLDGTYYLLTAPAETDIRVYAGEKLVAQLTDGLPQETDSLLAYGLRNGEIRIYLPAHEAYCVQLSDTQGVQLSFVAPRLLQTTAESISFSSEGTAFRLDIPGK